MKSLGAAVRTSKGTPPAARIASSSGRTMSSRWLKQIASFEEELTMATLGFVMSSSVSPRALHWARRTAHRELPTVRLLRRLVGMTLLGRGDGMGQAGRLLPSVGREPVTSTGGPIHGRRAGV